MNSELSWLEPQVDEGFATLCAAGSLVVLVFVRPESCPTCIELRQNVLKKASCHRSVSALQTPVVALSGATRFSFLA